MPFLSTANRRRGHSGQRRQQDRPTAKRARFSDLLSPKRREICPEPGDVELKTGAQADRCPLAGRSRAREQTPPLPFRPRPVHGPHSRAALGRRGQQPRCKQPGAPQDRRTAPRRLGFCRVQSHANPHVGSIGQFVGCKLPLSHDSGGQRRVRAVESKEEGIALRVDLASAARSDGFTEDQAMGIEYSAVPISQTFEQRRRALDVRKQQGDGAGGKTGRSQCRQASRAVADASRPIPSPANEDAARRLGHRYHSRLTFRSTLRDDVARLHDACSGPEYRRRSRSSCPKSQASPTLISSPQRAHATAPDATNGASNLRRA
jgi:hypothetical protein